jgi:glycosyltransferase involved in cell wall biosynthesis
MNVSYAILTHNEGGSIETLLQKLKEFKLPGDEIVIVDDLSTDKETAEILDKHFSSGLINRLTTRPLGNNFANQKNFLASLCEKEYIFNVDADEVPSDDLMRFLHMTLDMNPQVDMYAVPRWNTVEGITQEHIQKWGWRVDDQKRINWPDYQMRIYKNNKQIKWINPVHEILSGYKQYSTLPDSMCIMHPKDIQRQENQNNLYNQI